MMQSLKVLLIILISIAEGLPRVESPRVLARVERDKGWIRIRVIMNLL